MCEGEGCKVPQRGPWVVYIVGVVCNEAMGVVGEGQVWVDVVPG